jgi:hypothetical protein
MDFKKLPRFDVQIHIGAKVGYTDTTISEEQVLKYCQMFCDTNCVGVTVTRTNFVYPNGNEPGYIVGLINYPRFPVYDFVVFDMSFDFAQHLMQAMEQFRCTIFTPTEILVLENKFITEEMGEDL